MMILLVARSRRLVNTYITQRLRLTIPVCNLSVVMNGATLIHDSVRCFLISGFNVCNISSLTLNIKDTFN